MSPDTDLLVTDGKCPIGLGRASLSIVHRYLYMKVRTRLLHLVIAREAIHVIVLTLQID
jgi:hypothetical protein